MKKVKVAILGLGTVGGGVYEVVEKKHAGLKRTHELDIEVVKVLEKSSATLKKMEVPASKIAKNIEEILNDDSIDIVVETMGGIEPAKSFILRCFEAKKNVVSANKELIAKAWAELEAKAIEHDVGLYFEASCVGGVPIVRVLSESMQANNILELMGIVNGTTNYILTKMTNDNISYAEALAGAQKLGYAEADPTSDVEAFDSSYKLSILSSMAFHTCIPHDIIYREGITKITSADIESGRELGYRIKLLAIAKKHGKKIEVRCHPAFVPEDHPLANVDDAFNAVFLRGENVGDIMLYGRGAGALPTASAVVSDIVYCAGLREPKYTTFENEGELSDKITLLEDFESKYYFRVAVRDVPGMVGKKATILGKHNVSLDAIIQRGKNKNIAYVTYLTHATKEKSLMSALEEIENLDGIEGIESVIRVID
jgi:homoserine dehydrogenase